MVAAIVAAAYFHFIRDSELVFTHFFYIPSILAALWWKRRGLIAPIILAVTLVAFHYAHAGTLGLGDEFIRAGMLLVVTLAVAELSVQLERALVRDVDEALKSSEKQYRSLFEDSPLAMARIARGGSIKLANRRFTELTGYSAEMLARGMTLEQMLAEGETEGVMLLHQDRSRAEAAEYETSIRERGGQERMVKVSLSPVPGTDEDIVLFEDITERRTAERRIAESEEKYRMLIDAFPHSIVILQDRKVVFANPATLSIFGHESMDEVAGTDALSRVAERERERLRSFMSARERGDPEVPNHYYTVFQRKDGGEFVAEVFVSSISYGGRPAQQLIVVDVTERREAEEALKRSEREKQLILNSITEHVIYYGTDFKIVWANKAAADSIDLTPQDLVGQNCYELWHGRTEPCDECAVLKALETGEPHRFEIQSPDGRYWVIRGYPVKDNSGEIVGAVEFTQDVTARRQASEALRQAEELYHATIEATRDFVFLRDREGRYVAFNESSLKPLGIKQSDVIGKTAAELDVFPLESRTLWNEMHRHVLNTGNPVNYEDTLVLKGGVRIIETGLWPIKNKAGEVTHVAGFGRDITERKRAEEAVRESEMRYRTLVEQSQDPVAVIQGFFHVYANEAYCRLLGYADSSELIGKPLETTIAPVDREMVRKRYQQRLAGERVPSVYELRLMRRDGTELWVEASVQRRDFLGKPAVQSSYRDITERKLAEQTARQAEERLRTVADAVDAYLWSAEVSEDGTFRYEMYTAGVERITGLPPSRFTGVTSTWLDLVYPEDREIVLAAGKHLLMGEPQAGDYRVVRADGTRRWVHDSATPTVNDRGRVVRVDGVCYDITERKQVEDALRQSEEKYRTTFESTGTAMLIADGKDNILLANTEFERLTGYSKVEMIGKKKWHDMVSKEDLKRMTGYSRQRRSGGGAPSSYECTVVSREGTCKRTYINVQVIPGTDLSVASCLDITQLKDAEERLRTTELRLASLLERLPNVVLYETGGGREFISENIENLLGYTADSLTEDRTAFPKLIHPDDRQRTKKTIAKWHREGEQGVLKMRFRVRCADGEYIWIEDQMIIVHPEGGKQYMSGVLIDLGEQEPGES